MSSNVNRLAEFEQKLTVLEGGGFSPGAKNAFNALYTEYGFPGIEAMHNAGYDDPQKVWDFYVSCHKSVSEMAQKLNLE